MITRLQVREVAGYDEDVVFLGVSLMNQPLVSDVPIVIGTCTLACKLSMSSRRVKWTGFLHLG